MKDSIRRSGTGFAIGGSTIAVEFAATMPQVAQGRVVIVD
jgi:hypothetical protein